MRSCGLFAALLLVSAIGCGARSSLRDPDGGSGGAGATSAGVTSASATTASASGSGGGSSFVCAGLVSVEPRVEVPTSDGAAARDPLLQLLGTGDVLALVRGEALMTPDSLPSTVTAVRLEPWKVWPPTIHLPNVVYQGGWSTPFVAGLEPQGTFALSVQRFPMNNPKGCDLDAVVGISPDAPGVGGLVQPLAGTCDDVPIVIAAATDDGHLVANDLLNKAGGPSSRTLISVLLDPKGGVKTKLEPQCASTHFVGDTLRIDDGLLFVHSTSDGGSCESSPALWGPTRNLVIHRFQIAGAETENEYTGSDDMVYVRLLPGQAGSYPWLIFRESGASGEIQPPGMALPIGLHGGSASGFPITDPGAGQMAVAALGGGFVVATVDSLDPSAPTIRLSVYSSDGMVTAQTSFSTTDAWLDGDRLTLIASPDDTSFLVGWTGSTSTPGSSLFVRRFDCAGAK